MDYSFEDGDNFIRNAVTIRTGQNRPAAVVARKVRVSQDLPVALEDVMSDLRVDAASDATSVERMARGACALLERRTGFVLLAGSYEVELPSWWHGEMELNRGPLKAVTEIAYLAGANDWRPVDLASFYIQAQERTFSIRPLSTFDRPTLWSEVRRIRLRFDAGFAPADESSSDAGEPLEDGLRTMFLMLCGHFYENRQLFNAGQIETIEAGAAGFLGAYRQLWVRYPAVLSERLTLQRAIDGANLARFGDGELKIALGHDAKSQKHDPELQAALRRVLRDWRGRCVPCIPRIADRKSPKEAFWAQYRGERYCRLYDAGGFYGSSFISRPDSAPEPFTEDYWSQVGALWRGRDVVVVGGSGKSLKAGDLEGAASVEEVEAPRQHAWSAHAALLDRLKGESRLVVLCVGATATVLAWELAPLGVHAVDLGHLGMFLRKARSGSPLVVTDEDRAQP